MVLIASDAEQPKAIEIFAIARFRKFVSGSRCSEETISASVLRVEDMMPTKLIIICSVVSGLFCSLFLAGSPLMGDEMLSRSPLSTASYEQWAKGPWRPRGVQGRSFWFTLGGAEDSPIHRETIARKRLADEGLPMFGVAEWGYSFHHLKNGQPDGAGYKHFGGYPTTPRTREEAARFVHSYYDRLVADVRVKATDAQKQWQFSINGHYCYQHYGCQWGCDIVGSEVGENINSTQAHIAFTPGAARQFAKPWLIDFSSWYGPSMFDEDPKKHWGEYSGPRQRTFAQPS